MAATAAGRSPSPPAGMGRKIGGVDITIVSAKHLKNVNWRNGGELKPYAVAYLQARFQSLGPEGRRVATKPDDLGNTSPVWNERFTLPLMNPSEMDQQLLTIEVFHSKPSETPKPLVGSVCIPLRDLLPCQSSSAVLKTLELQRPSGRPQGKIRIKISPIIADQEPTPSSSLSHHHSHASIPSNYPAHYVSTAPFYYYSTPPSIYDRPVPSAPYGYHSDLSVPFRGLALADGYRPPSNLPASDAYSACRHPDYQ